jgi:hypothetical protein
MEIISTPDVSKSNARLIVNAGPDAREQTRRQQIVGVVLLVIVLFQLINLPGALMSRSAMDIGTVFLGLALCAAAAVFNRYGQATIVSLLLIAVVDLGCGLMLLTSPMGLDVGDLPVFDVLLVSELIAVSLLPAISVFYVGFANVLFIVLVLAFLPHTPALSMVLESNMGYGAVVQPISLQIVVAVIAYFWVRSALRNAARADRAEEIAQLQQREAELQRRDAERTRQLDLGSQHLLDVLVRAANGDSSVRANLSAANELWRVGGAVNLLLSRLRRSSQGADEIRRLREENARLTRVSTSRKAWLNKSIRRLLPFLRPRDLCRPEERRDGNEPKPCPDCF